MFDWDDPLGQQTPHVAASEGHRRASLHAEVLVQERDDLETTEAQETHCAAEAIDVKDVLAPVRAEDKRVINGMADINQLAPFRYPWAWKYFLSANKNHWTPLDINIAQDIQDYRYRLTAAERHVYENVLAYLTTSDILAMRNIGLAVMEKMSAPELQIYQARQVYEEALHTWTYQHCIESLGLDQGDMYNRYRVVPEMYHKIWLATQRLESILRPDIDLTRPHELTNFVMAYIFFAAVFEGCWFYSGFSPIFALQRRGLMKGTAEQLQYIMRPVLGYTAADHIEQFRYIANRRARQLHMDEPFPGAQCTLPWLDEQSNIRKEKNFFETRVTEYQTGSVLTWD